MTWHSGARVAQELLFLSSLSSFLTQVSTLVSGPFIAFEAVVARWSAGQREPCVARL